MNFNQFINESEEYVGYVELEKGKKLINSFKDLKSASTWKKKNEDDLLDSEGVQKVGVMPKSMWDSKEAKYAITEGISKPVGLSKHINERWKPLGLSIEETEKVAKDLAAALSKVDGVKFEITKGSLEPDAFDLDRDGEKWDGGSYTIHHDKTIVNNAYPGGPVYGKVGDSIDKMIKTIKSVHESFLDAYDKDSEELDESRITIKRRYTDSHPAQTVGKFATIRNKVLEAIKDGKISNEEFNTILKEMTKDSSRWLKRNAQYFNVSEEGVTLSKVGMKVLNSIAINEATTKNPEVWVPGGFDKEIGKHPNAKITRKLVLDAAKKWDVKPEDAIAYVEYGWMVDLDENKQNNNMNNSKFIYESFSEFVENRLNENNESLLEAIKSSILAGFISMYAAPKDLFKAFYQYTKADLNAIEDADFIEMAPSEAYKSKNLGAAIVFYVSRNEKPNPYTYAEGYNNRMIPGNALLAIANGQNEFFALEFGKYNIPYDSRGKRFRTFSNVGKDANRKDTAGISKDYKGWNASGLSNVKRISNVADVAYVLPMDVIRAKYSTEALKRQREEAKRGATALMDPRKIKDENIAKYKEILAQRLLNKDEAIDKEVEKVVSSVNQFIMDGFAAKQMSQYGEIILGRDPKGREVRVSDTTNYLKNVLEYYAKYVNAANALETAKSKGEDKWEVDYYEKEIKRYTLSTREYLKKWNDKTPNIAW